MSWKGTGNENNITRVELGKLAFAIKRSTKTLKTKRKSNN